MAGPTKVNSQTVTLGVAGAAGHGTNSQHSPTLALFEIKDQLMNGHTTGKQTNFEISSKRMFWLTDSQPSECGSRSGISGTPAAHNPGVNPSVETICNWHTCRLLNFSAQTAFSLPEWPSVGEAEAGSGGDQPAEE
jgi:hypothetical protein